MLTFAQNNKCYLVKPTSSPKGHGLFRCHPCAESVSPLRFWVKTTKMAPRQEGRKENSLKTKWFLSGRRTCKHQNGSWTGYKVKLTTPVKWIFFKLAC